MFGMSISRQSSQHYYASLSSPSPSPSPHPPPLNSHALHILHKYFSQPNDLIQACHSAPTTPPPPRGRQAFCIIAKSYYAVAFRVYRFVLHTLRLVESFSIYKRVFFPVLFSVLFLLYIFPVFSPGFCCILCSLCSFAWRTLSAWFLQFA